MYSTIQIITMADRGMMYMSDRQLERFLKDQAKESKPAPVVVQKPTAAAKRAKPADEQQDEEASGVTVKTGAKVKQANSASTRKNGPPRKQVRIEEPAPPVVTATASIDDDGSTDSTDYLCVCKHPSSLDDGREMIQCDACSNWLHPECVSLDPTLVPLVGIYICPECQADPAVTWTTTWLLKCGFDSCVVARREPLSKYCSTLCGVKQALHILTQKDITVDQFAGRSDVTTAPCPEAYMIRHTDNSNDAKIECAVSAQTYQVSTDTAEKDILTARWKSLQQQLTTVELAQTVLERAVEHADQLVLPSNPLPTDGDGDATMDATPETTTSNKKTKKKTAKKTVSEDDHRPCGFTLNLVDSKSHPSSPCMHSRRKCPKHVGWQRVRAAALDMDRANLVSLGKSPQSSD